MYVHVYIMCLLAIYVYDCLDAHNVYIICLLAIYGHYFIYMYIRIAVAILHIQNSIILIQTTEYNNFIQKHPDITLTMSVLLT